MHWNKQMSQNKQTNAKYFWKHDFFGTTNTEHLLGQTSRIHWILVLTGAATTI